MGFPEEFPAGQTSMIEIDALVCWLNSIRANPYSAACKMNGPLQFTENGTFQLTVFSDLHFAEGIGSIKCMIVVSRANVWQTTKPTLNQPG